MAPTPINITFGTIAGYTVRASKRAASAGDSVGGRTAIVVTLSNGTNTYEAAVYNDDTDGSGKALAAGYALIRGFAAIGASTSLGAPGGTPAQASSSTSPLLVYTSSAPLTPGMPLPAGRGALVKASGTVLLKLAGGGTYPVSDETGGSGTRFDNLAVIDADVSGSPGATVSILY
ncbi:lipoprotein LpqB, beta-propeller domain-like protein [Methylorubrum populi]|uniref:Lipoprotein LpqB, beta-propeller domain-like protein n=1 Tax=Methylorubrum populi TaxID=223967 RepID=A0A160PAY4_9HYPH|nr:hypothetical protein [Methylorubrum populi]BAU89374.1 lipoprotein LpqB, beta-propeller domain-like protein [Methylorubrum populi]